MTRNEFNTLFKEIQTEFSEFNGDYDEWYKMLCNYSFKDILNNLHNYKGNKPPLYSTLIKKLREEEKIDNWITCCDICGQRITIYNNDMTDYEIHRRKCSKIDFIDRMSKKYKGKGITWRTYYDMSDEDLNIAYHQIMNYWLQHREGNNILKQIPN